MNIAVMTVFCNEAFRIPNWKSFYNEYKAEIVLHVIINNGTSSDTALLKEHFPESVILESDSNNLLHAYNIGLKYIFEHCEIDAIMQITNDVRFNKDAMRKLYEVLFSDENIGAVGPVLQAKDSDIIESFGFMLGKYSSKQTPLNVSKRVCELESLENTEVSFIPAGTIMVKRSAWEKVGYQDELLHMYNDERDFALRMKHHGYREVVVPTALAWHQHINPVGKKGRSRSSIYYSSRNKIYLTYKYYGQFYALADYLRNTTYSFILIISHILRFDKEKLKSDKVNLKGLWAGLIRNMNNQVKFD